MHVLIIMLILKLYYRYFYSRPEFMVRTCSLSLMLSGYLILCVFLIFSDKPEVKIVVEFPQGLTREGENLELSCKFRGKPEYDTSKHTQTYTFNQLMTAVVKQVCLPANSCTSVYSLTYHQCIVACGSVCYCFSFAVEK